MTRCWCKNPGERPDFSELCSIMDRFLNQLSDFTELRMELVEEQSQEHHGKYTVIYAQCSQAITIVLMLLEQSKICLGMRLLVLASERQL